MHVLSALVLYNHLWVMLQSVYCACSSNFLAHHSSSNVAKQTCVTYQAADASSQRFEIALLTDVVLSCRSGDRLIRGEHFT